MFEDVERNTRRVFKNERTGKKPMTPEQMRERSLQGHKQIRLWFSKQKPLPHDGFINMVVTRKLIGRGMRRATERAMNRKAGGYAKD